LAGSSEHSSASDRPEIHACPSKAALQVAFFLLIERDPIRWIDDRIRNAPLPPMGGAGKVNDLIDRRRITAFTM
jgi:hypothetical protein